MIFALQDALDKIAEIINVCLGPLGSEGFTFDSVRDFLIQMGSTLIIFLVVKFFLWKPVTELIEKKRAAIDQALTDANEARTRAISLEQKLNLEYEESKQEINRLLSAAVLEGNTQKEEIIKSAQEEARRRLKASQEEIAQEVLKMKDQIRQEIVDIAFMAAEKIVAKEINPEKYIELVDEIIKSGVK